MEYGPQQASGGDFVDVDPQGLEGTVQIVVWAGDEMRRQLRMNFEIRVAEPVHADHPSVVSAIERRQSRDRGNAGVQHDEQHGNGDRDEGPPEVIRLGDQGQGDHRARQDGQKNVDSGQ